MRAMAAEPAAAEGAHAPLQRTLERALEVTRSICEAVAGFSDDGQSQGHLAGLTYVPTLHMVLAMRAC